MALEDDEYPEWLWRCLDEKKAVNGNGAVGGDEFCRFHIVFFALT